MSAKAPKFLRYLDNNFVTDNDIKDITLYDTKITRECLRGKYAVILGDSSTTETVHDLIFLLSGLVTNSKMWGFYFQNVVNHHNTMKTTKEIEDLYDDADAIIDVDKDNGHRNLTFSLSKYNIYIRYRFNAGTRLGDNGHGLLGMFDPTVTDEYKCLFGEPSTLCRKPDIIVIQDGFHETLDRFQKGIPKIMPMLRKAKNRGTKVFWLSSRNFFGRLKGFDEINLIAKDYCSKFGITFVDPDLTSARFNNSYGEYPLTHFYFEHPNFHIGSLSTSDSKKLALSSYLTQNLLAHIC